MISKLVAWERDRKEAIERMKRALYEYIILGVKTNIPFHKAVLNNKAFIEGNLSTHFIQEQEHLIQEMNRIIEEESSLQQKLSTIFKQDIKLVAAAAAVEAYRNNCL